MGKNKNKIKIKETKFKCQKCSLEWKQKPGPTVCLACGYKYLEWVNYEKDFEKISQ